MKCFFNILILLSLFGCASGPRFQSLVEADENKGVLYILRPSSIGFLDGVEIEVNGKEVGEVRAKGYKVIHLDKGVQSVIFPIGFGQIGNEVGFDISIDPGQRYFYVYDISMGNVIAYPGMAAISLKNGIAEISEEQALVILSDLSES